MSALGEGRTAYLLTAQSNEYKLIFEHVMLWLQFALFTSIDSELNALSVTVSSSCLALVLWKMFLPATET